MLFVLFNLFVVGIGFHDKGKFFFSATLSEWTAVTMTSSHHVAKRHPCVPITSFDIFDGCHMRTDIPHFGVIQNHVFCSEVQGMILLIEEIWQNLFIKWSAGYFEQSTGLQDVIDGT